MKGGCCFHRFYLSTKERDMPDLDLRMESPVCLAPHRFKSLPQWQLKSWIATANTATVTSNWGPDDQEGSWSHDLWRTGLDEWIRVIKGRKLRYFFVRVVTVWHPSSLIRNHQLVSWSVEILPPLFALHIATLCVCINPQRILRCAAMSWRPPLQDLEIQ